MRNYVYNMDPDDLKERVVGRRITFIDEEGQTLTLDDGTVLQFEEGGECCAYFEPTLKGINLSDNAITSVVSEETAGGAYDDVSWRATILSYDIPVATLDVNGNSGTGYYGNSIDLRIIPPTHRR